MSLGERGGTTSNLAEAERLHAEYKAEWRSKIRWRIVQCLVETGRFHASDLVDLAIPEDCKNVIGSCTGAAKKKGVMLETGERLPSTDTAGHGRTSAVYVVNPAAKKGLAEKWRRRKASIPPPEPTHLFDPDAALEDPGPVSSSYYQAEAA